MAHDVKTIVVGGAAGDGVRETGIHIAEFLGRLGYEVFMSFNYPSLIRGGHNFSRISFAKEKVWNDHSKTDILVALNSETCAIHADSLSPNAVLIGELDEGSENSQGLVRIGMPFGTITEAAGGPHVARGSVALGALARLMNIPKDRTLSIAAEIFQDLAPALNLKLVELGFDRSSLPAEKLLNLEPGSEPKTLRDGNTAVAEGLAEAKLDLYVAYPMTPATSILHYLAKHSEETHVLTIQPEDEIASIMMALGASYAGKRAAVGTATGGFALMQEAMSFSGMAELPVAVVVSQRQGPATGVATHSAQADLLFTIHSGHGEFPRLVIAPGDAEEAHEAGSAALNLAWKYQIPAIVLMDKHLSESSMTGAYLPTDRKPELGKRASAGDYRRYEPAEDGISPLAFPGTPNVAVKVTSNEHEPDGTITHESSAVKLMQDKRFQKGLALAKESGAYRTVKVYGDPKAETAVVCWGSTKGVVLEAMYYLKKPVRVVQPIWMEPFDADGFIKAMEGATTLIDVEMNRTAQLASLIREKTGVYMNHIFIRYDSEMMDPLQLAGEMNTLLS